MDLLTLLVAGFLLRRLEGLPPEGWRGRPQDHPFVSPSTLRSSLTAPISGHIGEPKKPLETQVAKGQAT